MTKITNAALFFLAAGIFTSVTILGAYQILFAVSLIYFSYMAYKKNQLVLPKSAWFLLLFSLVSIISLLANIEQIPKPSQNFGKIKYFIYGVGGIYVFRVWLKEASSQTKKILLYTFFLTIVVAAIFGISTMSEKQFRLRAFTRTMRYGYGSAMMLLVLLSAILHHQKIKAWFNWKIALPVFILGFAGMYLTYTRGALLGFVCGLPFVIYFYRKKWGILTGVMSLVVLLGIGGFYIYGTGNYSSRFLINKNNVSDNTRRSQWQAAIIAIKEKPILGWGLSNFHTQVKRIKDEHNLDVKDYNNAHAHNLFLETAAGTGILGLIFLVGWLTLWAIECFIKGGMVRALIVPFGVCFVISSQFEVTFDANNASMIFFLYALSSAIPKDITSSDQLN